jgi:hypothetical protein
MLSIDNASANIYIQYKDYQISKDCGMGLFKGVKYDEVIDQRQIWIKSSAGYGHLSG